MAEAAAAAAALRQLRLKHLHDSCLALQSRAITVLSLKDPERDWHRWLDELLAVVKQYGPDFVAALDYDADIPAVVAVSHDFFVDTGIPILPI